MIKKKIVSDWFLFLLLSPILFFYISTFLFKNNELFETISIYLRLIVPFMLVVFSTFKYLSVKIYKLQSLAIFTILIFCCVIFFTKINEGILIDSEGRSSLSYFVNVNILNFSYFVWGSLFANYLHVKENTIFFKVLILIFLILLVNISLDTFSIDYYKLSLKNNYNLKSHLGYTDFYFVVAFFSYNSTRSKNVKRIIITIFFLGLFFLGGRSAFVFSLIPYVLIYHRKNYVLISLSFLTSIIVFIVYSRQIITVTNDDFSLLERLLFNESFFTFYRQNIFKHSINTVIVIEGDLGKHVHNFLSYLEAYGILGFSVILVLLRSVYNKLTLLKKSIAKQNLMFLFFYILSQFILAKTISWVYLWLLLGVLIGMYYKVKQEQGNLINKSII